MHSKVAVILYLKKILQTLKLNKILESVHNCANIYNYKLQ